MIARIICWRLVTSNQGKRERERQRERQRERERERESMYQSPSLPPFLSYSVSSNIAQMYLSSILETYQTTDVTVRLLTTQTILLILRQGLVHPGQCVPFLIALSTDPETQVTSKIEAQLTDYGSKYGGFMQVRMT